MIINIFCPTRNRPDNVNRLIQSIEQTTTNKENVNVIFYIDEDDDSYTKTADIVKEHSDLFLSIEIGPKLILSDIYNYLFKKHSHEADDEIFMFCGDDVVFKTEGWDIKVAKIFNEYPDRIVFVYGYDGAEENKNFGTHGFLHKNWARVIGRLTPPYFKGNYTDTWINNVSDIIGRKRRVDALFEHMHYCYGKSELDETYMRVRQGEIETNAIFQYYSRITEIMHEAEQLRQFIENYNLGHHILDAVIKNPSIINELTNSPEDVSRILYGNQAKDMGDD